MILELLQKSPRFLLNLIKYNVFLVLKKYIIVISDKIESNYFEFESPATLLDWAWSK